LKSIPGNFKFVINDESITSTVFKRFLEFAHSHVFDHFSRDETLEAQSQNVKENLKIDSSTQRTVSKITLMEGKVGKSQ
jgi:hypothetical protein